MSLHPVEARNGHGTRALALALLMVAGGLAALAGCDPRQAMFFLQPLEPKLPPKAPSLKGKKVVILTAAAAGLRTDYLNIDREIARKLADILREKVKKIEVVDPADVAQWAEGKPTLTDPSEAATAYAADVVVFLELREFQIQDPSSPGLFSGRSNTHIQMIELAHPTDARGRPMTDRPRESKLVYEGDATSTFPVTGPIPIEAGVNNAVFKTRFLDVVVSEISWHFVEHSPGDNIQNTRFHE